MLKTCPVCKKSFYTNKARAKYCSVECRRKQEYLNRDKNRPVLHKTCIICGKKFDTTNSIRTTCSYACQEKRKIQYLRQKYAENNAHKHVETQCENCGKTFIKGKRRRFCCVACARQYTKLNKDKYNVFPLFKTKEGTNILEISDEAKKWYRDNHNEFNTMENYDYFNGNEIEKEWGKPWYLSRFSIQMNIDPYPV